MSLWNSDQKSQPLRVTIFPFNKRRLPEISRRYEMLDTIALDRRPLRFKQSHEGSR